MSGSFERSAGLSITSGRMWIIVFTIAVFFALQLVLQGDAVRPARCAPSPRTAAWHPPWAYRPAGSTRWPSGSARASPGSPGSPSRRSTTSRRTSGRATSSTASWWWCSAAWAIFGARWLPRSRARHRQQVPRAPGGRGAGQDRHPGLHHPLHPEAAARSCSRSRAGPWRHDHAVAISLRPARQDLYRRPRRCGDPGSDPGNLETAARLGASPVALCDHARRQVPVLCAARGRARPRLGLLRDPVARPRRLLRPRRVCDGYVSHAPDRSARFLCKPGPARLHGLLELAFAARDLVGLLGVPLRDG